MSAEKKKIIIISSKTSTSLSNYLYSHLLCRYVQSNDNDPANTTLHACMVSLSQLGETCKSRDTVVLVITMLGDRIEVEIDTAINESGN